PSSACRKQGFGRNAQELVDTHTEAAPALRPCAQPDRSSLVATGCANEKRGRFRVQVEFHGLDTAIVRRELIPLPRYSSSSGGSCASNRAGGRHLDRQAG